jgi:hypothetical protein
MRENRDAELFMKEFFGENYTEEQCNLSRDIVRGIAMKFTRCAINFNMSTPQFTPAIDSNYLMTFADELVKEKQEDD